MELVAFFRAMRVVAAFLHLVESGEGARIIGEATTKVRADLAEARGTDGTVN